METRKGEDQLSEHQLHIVRQIIFRLMPNKLNCSNEFTVHATESMGMNGGIIAKFNIIHVFRCAFHLLEFCIANYNFDIVAVFGEKNNNYDS